MWPPAKECSAKGLLLFVFAAFAFFAFGFSFAAFAFTFLAVAFTLASLFLVAGAVFGAGAVLAVGGEAYAIGAGHLAVMITLLVSLFHSTWAVSLGAVGRISVAITSNHCKCESDSEESED